MNEAPTRLFSPVPSVLLIVLTIVALFGVSGVIYRSRRPPVTVSGITQPVTSGQAASQDRAATIYSESCTGCHGPANTNMQFVRADYLKGKSDLEVMTTIRTGRAANALDNTSSKAMPANGGRINLTDEELVALVKYLRQAKGV